MKGDWVNELGSVLQIDSINKQGDIIGVYRSSTGVDGKEFKLKGYVNTSEEYPTEKNISFAVRWIGYGSITSWSGYCTQLNNKDQIKTMWHLVRSGKEFDWERVITNASVFTPKNK
ncbi:MAG: avidin/streptavidin family protein [Saprospiraceae bacterium]